MPGIGCNDGPHVYREWLGSQFVDPWIKVKRCISYRCKPSEEKKIAKLKISKDTSKMMFKVDQHVKCKQLRKR